MIARWLMVLANMMCLLSPSWAGTLEDAKAHGVVRCAVSADAKPLSSLNSEQSWSGFAVDFCRAVAGAVLGKTDATAFVPVTSHDHIATLQAGDVDLLLVDGHWTVEQQLRHGLLAVAPLWLQPDGRSGVWIVVRQGDETWALAAKLVLSVLLLANERTIVSAETNETALSIGLHGNWASTLNAFGSFEHIATKHFGNEVKPGPNAPWSKGGVHLLP